MMTRNKELTKSKCMCFELAIASCTDCDPINAGYNIRHLITTTDRSCAL